MPWAQVINEQPSNEKPLCFLDIGQKLTLDVIARCALATKINCIEDDKDKLFLQVKQFLANSESLAFHLAQGLKSLSKILLKIAE